MTIAKNHVSHVRDRVGMATTIFVVEQRVFPKYTFHLKLCPVPPNRRDNGVSNFL